MALTSRVLVISLLLTCATAWYIPGVAPLSYTSRQPVVIKANSMTSSDGLFPYSAYSIKTCTPPKADRKAALKHENLGEILYGDEILPSLYRAEMQVNSTCRKLCDTLQYTPAEMQLIQRRIEQHYRGNLILDNLPISQENHASSQHPPLTIGYPLGVPKKWSADKKTTHINNHLAITIEYHKPKTLTLPEPAWRVVGFFVRPHSVQHTPGGASCEDGKPFNPEEFPPLKADAKEITWTYSVSWRENPNVEWATRWDVILRSADVDNKIHWFSIINSLLIVLFLTGMVAMILMRALHKDFNRYNDPDNEDAAKEETGWKMVHGDVFRPPVNASMLAILTGTGCQLLGMTVITLIMALVGFLSPANRGMLLTCILLLFVLLGGYAGYVSARLCKFFKVQSWFNIFMTATTFPGTLMAIYIALNFVHSYKNATTAIPFTSLLSLLGLWFGISLPLVIVGAAVGFKRPVLEAPCKVNDIRRPIPPQHWYIQPQFVVPVAGVLPFGAVFIELVFILSSLWQGRVYYVFGFLALVFLIAVATCAEISIVIVYFQLCYEDYNWWWRSFFCSASSGLHLFLYSIIYFFHTLQITQLSSAVLYFGYMSMISLFFATCTGTIGFLASMFFVWKIYSCIKVD